MGPYTHNAVQESCVPAWCPAPHSDPNAFAICHGGQFESTTGQMQVANALRFPHWIAWYKSTPSKKSAAHTVWYDFSTLKINGAEIALHRTACEVLLCDSHAVPSVNGP